MARREKAERARAAAGAAVEAYEQVREVDVAVELPEAVRAATLRLRRSGK
jgi:hypothetical protein